MKRVYLIFQIFFLCNLSFTNIKQNTEINLISNFKTLDWQLSKLISNRFHINDFKKKLASYLNSHNKDILNGLKLVLLEKDFNKYVLAEKAKLRIDGFFNDWESILFSIYDVANDVELPEADIIKFKAYLDNEKNLYVFFETKSNPSTRSVDSQTYSVNLKFSENINYLLGIDFNTINGSTCHYQTYNVKTRIASKWKKVNFASAISGNKIEAKIPLSSILNSENINIKNEIEISASIFHKKLKKQRDFLNKYITISVQKKNYALELLIFLLSKNIYILDDSITMAMILANNYYYKKFDAPTRKKIISDIQAHIEFYKETIALQKKLNLPFSLQNASLENKIIWSFRDARPAQPINWNLNDYNVFFDKIDSFRYIQQLIIQSAVLAGGFSFKKVGEFVAMHTEYSSTIEMIWLWHGDRNDKKRYTTLELVRKLKNKNLPAWCKNVISDFENNRYFIHINGHKIFHPQRDWLNAQIELYKRNRKFRGGCGVSAIIEKSFYKSLGIPAYQKYFYSIDPNFVFDHMFTIFFNYRKGIWQSLYRNNFLTKHRINPDVRTVNYPILFHHELKNQPAIIKNMSALELDVLLINKGISVEFIEKNILTYQYYQTLN